MPGFLTYLGRFGVFFFFSSRRRHTMLTCDWSSDVCSSDLTCSRPPGRERDSCARKTSRCGRRPRRPSRALPPTRALHPPGRRAPARSAPPPPGKGYPSGTAVFGHSRTGVRAAWPAAAVGPGAGRASLRAHPGPLSRVPVAERPPERLFGLRRHVVHPQPAGELDRAPHLFDICRAAVTGRKMRVEALALAGRQIALEVRRDELDQLPAIQMGQTDGHGSSDRYCSSARLTLARPR